jgi:hypothetical protein
VPPENPILPESRSVIGVRPSRGVPRLGGGMGLTFSVGACPSQMSGASRHCLSLPIVDPIGLRGTPGPLLSQGSLEGLSIANAHPELAVGWQRTRANGDCLGGHP